MGKLIEDNIVESFLLHRIEYLLFFQYVLDNFVFQFRLVLQYFLNDRMHPGFVGRLRKKEFRKNNPFLAEALADFFHFWEERSANFPHLLALFLCQVGYKVKISCNIRGLPSRASQVLICTQEYRQKEDQSSCKTEQEITRSHIKIPCIEGVTGTLSGQACSPELFLRHQASISLFLSAPATRHPLPSDNLEIRAAQKKGRKIAKLIQPLYSAAFPSGKHFENNLGQLEKPCEDMPEHVDGHWSSPRRDAGGNPESKLFRDIEVGQAPKEAIHSIQFFQFLPASRATPKVKRYLVHQIGGQFPVMIGR
jgi:hypothetical protein